MQYANIKRIVGDKVGSKIQIRNLFKMMQRDMLIREEPLFWLQYSIVMTEDEIWDLAENFMQSAYDKAHNTSNFETYQIDTQWLRLMMMLEARSNLPTVVRIKEIEEYIRIVGNMLYLSGHRSFVIRVLAEVVPFLKICGVKLSGQELDLVLARLRQIVDILGNFSPQTKAETGSAALEEALSSAVSKYGDRRPRQS